MKIRDIINTIDKSDSNKDKVNVYSFAEKILGLDVYYEYVESNRLISYYFGDWYYDGAYYGYKVYFFDDEPVAVSSKFTANKEEIEWISKEMFLKVKEYVLSIVFSQCGNITILDLDEDAGDGYKIDGSYLLMDSHKEHAIFNNKKVKITNVEKEIITVEYEDGNTEKVAMTDLLFPYHLNSELVKKQMEIEEFILGCLDKCKMVEDDNNFPNCICWKDNDKPYPYYFVYNKQTDEFMCERAKVLNILETNVKLHINQLKSFINSTISKVLNYNNVTFPYITYCILKNKL